MIKLKLRGDAPAITWTNAEVEALVTERDKLLERLAANTHYDEKILAENQKLHAALKQIASIPNFDESEDVVWTDTAIALAAARQIAIRALEETK
jgi:hypothetical protein